MTERSCYCYKVMPFGLKNVGAMYQRLMDKVLAPMLGRNVQAYVDDMVVTSLEKSKHVSDLEELFTTIAKFRLKLNPEKCIFGVEAGKFLGFRSRGRFSLILWSSSRQKQHELKGMIFVGYSRWTDHQTNRVAVLESFWRGPTAC